MEDIVPQWSEQHIEIIGGTYQLQEMEIWRVGLTIFDAYLEL